MIWPYLMSFFVTWLYTTPRKKNTSMTCLKPSLKPYTMLWRPSTNIISKWLLRTQKVFPVITNIFRSRSGLGRIHSSSSRWGGKWYFPGSPATALQRGSHTSRAAIWWGKRLRYEFIKWYACAYFFYVKNRKDYQRDKLYIMAELF